MRKWTKGLWSKDKGLVTSPIDTIGETLLTHVDGFRTNTVEDETLGHTDIDRVRTHWHNWTQWGGKMDVHRWLMIAFDDDELDDMMTMAKIEQAPARAWAHLARWPPKAHAVWRPCPGDDHDHSSDLHFFFICLNWASGALEQVKRLEWWSSWSWPRGSRFKEGIIMREKYTRKFNEDLPLIRAQ